jgi:vacuolar protein-sorting-associated protein 4
VQMDGVGHDNTGVLVLAATNLPWALDPAVRRRFQKKIHIPLPDKGARTRLLRICVGNTSCGLTPGQYQELAERTEGFSGSDISILVQDALMAPIKSLHTPSYYHSVSTYKTCALRKNLATRLIYM